MATENPKISAYVPQVVYDRFKQYQEERKLSMSQAVAQLITEYFGIDPSKSIAEQSTNELPSRLERVEQELEGLKQKTANLLMRVDELQSTRELPTNFSYDFFSELISRLSSELQEQLVGKLLEGQSKSSYVQLEIADAITDAQSNQVYSSESEISESLLYKPLNKTDSLEIIEAKNTLKNDLNSESGSLTVQLDENTIENTIDEIKIKSEVLAQRLQISSRHLGNQKSRLSYEEFTEWITKKDPDGIGWQLVKEGGKIYYSPISSLSSKLRSKLLKMVSQ